VHGGDALPGPRNIGPRGDYSDQHDLTPPESDRLSDVPRPSGLDEHRLLAAKIIRAREVVAARRGRLSLVQLIVRALLSGFEADFAPDDQFAAG
jgi:hypothetical protein